MNSAHKRVPIKNTFTLEVWVIHYICYPVLTTMLLYCGSFVVYTVTNYTIVDFDFKNKLRNAIFHWLLIYLRLSQSLCLALDTVNFVKYDMDLNLFNTFYIENKVKKIFFVYKQIPIRHLMMLTNKLVIVQQLLKDVIAKVCGGWIVSVEPW